MLNKQLFVIGLLLLTMISCKDERSGLGDRYFERGEYQKAIESYNKYIHLYPEHLKSIYNRGRAYEEIGEYEKALEDFRHVLRKNPENISAILSLANDFYVRKKDYENTIFYADKALDLNEKNALAYVLRGRANQKLGNVNQALSDYNNAISVDKNYAEAYISRGSLRLAAKQKSRACGDFKTAAALGSSQAEQLLKKYCR